MLPLFIVSRGYKTPAIASKWTKNSDTVLPY